MRVPAVLRWAKLIKTSGCKKGNLLKRTGDTAFVCNNVRGYTETANFARYK